MRTRLHQREALALLCSLVILGFAAPALAVPITGGLVANLEASAANVTQTVNLGPNGMPRVSAWADTSAVGGVNNATQGTVNAQPEYFASVATLNNRPALHFFGSGVSPTFDPDGSFDEMIIGSTSGNFPNAVTLFIVGRPESIGTAGPQHNLYDTSNSTDSYWNFQGSSGYMGMWRNTRVEGTFPTGGAALSGNQIFELVVESTAGHGSTLSDYRYFENAVAKGNDPVGSGGPADTYFANSTFHKLGNAAGSINTKAYEGYVAEVLVYNVALDEAQRAVISNHLNSKYNTGGTTVGVNQTLGANDFYAGDLDTNSDNDLDVFGIGIHSGGDSVNTLAIAGLSLTQANSSFTNNEWLFAGHDDPTNALIPAGAGVRWSRDFYVDKTGALDATLTFDFSDGGLVAPSFGELDVIQLLYSEDGVTFNPLGINGVVTGDQVAFLVSDSLLLDGFYTLSIVQIPEPSTCAILAFSARAA